MVRKTKSGPNKSHEIRDYRLANPAAPPKETAEAMKKAGITVHPILSARFLSQAKRKGCKIGKPGRNPNSLGTPAKNEFEQLLRAKRLADTLGGVNQARTTLDALARLIAQNRVQKCVTNPAVGETPKFCCRSCHNWLQPLITWSAVVNCPAAGQA